MSDFDTLLDGAADEHPQQSEQASALRAEACAELGIPAVGEGGAQVSPGTDGPAGWNPEIHESPPRKTTRGTWALRRGARAACPDAPPDPVTAAQNMCATFFAMAAALLGEEWAPSEGERAEVERCLARVFVAHGAIDLPPVAGLIVALGMYSIPRALQPESREKIGRAVASVRGFLTGKREDPRDPGCQRDNGSAKPTT